MKGISLPTPPMEGVDVIEGLRRRGSNESRNKDSPSIKLQRSSRKEDERVGVRRHLLVLRMGNYL